jgi:integral membrane protein
LNAALTRYRVMAYLVGAGLLVLTLIGVPLQYAAGRSQVVAVVGPIHGFLYIIYLAMAYDLARRARFTLLQLAAMVGAGLVPFLAFVVEHRVVQRVRAEQELGRADVAHLVPRVALRQERGTTEDSSGAPS